MFTLESNVDISKIKAGRGNPVVMSLNPSPQISFTMENANINKDMFSALCYNLSQMGTTAAETGQALRKLVRALNEQNQRWEYTAEKLPELVDKINAIGCVNPVTPEEISQGLLRAETPGTTENPNQKEPFDFLEQNAYEEADSGWLTPLDSI